MDKAPGRQERTIWTAWEAPGRQERINWEACSTGWPIESRFWKGAGFCITFNTISIANGPVRGKS